MGVGPVCRTSLPTGLSEWGLGYIPHATWNGSLYSLAAFKVFSLSLNFAILIMMYLGVHHN